MKKATIALAVAIASLTSVAYAAPADNTWYLGGKVGWSSYHHNGFESQTVSDENAKKNRVGFGGFLGYQVNPYLGFELGYDYLGRMNYDSTATTVEGSYKVHGPQITAKVGYPIMDNLDLYARLGGFIWMGESKVDGSKFDSDTGISPLTAIGLEYAMTRDIAARLDYQWVYKIGDYNTVGVKPDNGLLSVGLSYRFGQAPKAMAVARNDLAVKVNRFVLTNEVLFDFNKSTIKNTGHQSLDKLYNEISNLQPTEGAVVVYGYTDRIGSDSVNMAISKQRAESVMRYLVSKGIPVSAISAKGLGKADSLTGAKCDALRGAQLKTCLAPDRRVVVEVKGLHETVHESYIEAPTSEY